MPAVTAVGVVGNGFVGQAMRQLAGPQVRVISYDIDPSMCQPRGTTLRDVSQTDIIFVSVPTPMESGTGEVHVGIVEDVVHNLRDLAGSDICIVIRSTVPPGTCRRLGVYFMPEFLTEANAAEDFRNTPTWICGAPNTDSAERRRAFAERMRRLLDAAHAQGAVASRHLECIDSSEAEMIKYFRNTFLATKVSFCNEMYALCRKIGVEYETVRYLAAADARITPSHTRVPGPDQSTGFGGTCFPKDTHGLRVFCEKNGVPCPVLRAVIHRNEHIDRPQRDWMQDKGRATL